MAERPFIILPCPGCGVKNRVQNYDPKRVPVCSKCKTRLVDEEEHEIQSNYRNSLNRFMDLPGFGPRSDSEE